MRRLIAIAVAVSVGVTALFFLLLLRPKLNAIQETKDNIEIARDDEQQLRNRLVRLEEARRNAPELLARLDRVRRLLPPDPDLPGFIRLIQAAAEDSSIDLESIAPAPPQTLADTTDIETIQVSLTVVGGFRRIEDFLSRIENLERVVEVRSLSLTPEGTPGTSQTILRGTIGLRMYVVGPNASLTPPLPGTPAEPSPGGAG